MGLKHSIRPFNDINGISWKRTHRRNPSEDALQQTGEMLSLSKLVTFVVRKLTVMG